MSDELDISFEEILREIEKQQQANPIKGFTLRQMVKETGWGKTKCQDALKKLISLGRAYCSGKTRIERIDGQVGWTPVYKMKDSDEPK